MSKNFSVVKISEAAQRTHNALYMNLECLITELYEKHPEKLDNLVKEVLKDAHVVVERRN